MGNLRGNSQTTPPAVPGSPAGAEPFDYGATPFGSSHPMLAKFAGMEGSPGGFGGGMMWKAAQQMKRDGYFGDPAAFGGAGGSGGSPGMGSPLGMGQPLGMGSLLDLFGDGQRGGQVQRNPQSGMSSFGGGNGGRSAPTESLPWWARAGASIGQPLNGEYGNLAQLLGLGVK